MANQAVGYSREIDDAVLRFAPSGWTYGEEVSSSTFVLADKTTESLWFPMTDGDCCALVGISGAYADARAGGIQNMQPTTWANWVALHPGSGVVLD